MADVLRQRASSVHFLTVRPVISNEDSSRNETAADKEHQRRLKNARQNHTRPTGIVSVHVKHVQINYLNTTGAFVSPEQTVYMRLTVAKQIKCTCQYEGVIAPAKIIMDELKHFNVQVSPKGSEASNYLCIEVVAFQKEDPKTHHIVAIKSLHLYDVMKRLFVVEALDIYKADKNVARVELEMCFAYGMFGYGYSSQFENRLKSLKDHVQHSMFCREEPPLSRRDGYRNIMLARPIGHPGFILFANKVEIGDTSLKYKSDMSVHEWQTIEEPVLLISKMRRKMLRLYQGYTEQQDRRSRLDYLRTVITDHVPKSNINEDVMTVPDNFKLQRRQYHHSLIARMDRRDSGRLLNTDTIKSMDDGMERLPSPGVIGLIRGWRDSLTGKLAKDAPQVQEVYEERRSSIAKVVGGMWQKLRGYRREGQTETDKAITEDRYAITKVVGDMWQRLRGIRPEGQTETDKTITPGKSQVAPQTVNIAGDDKDAMDTSTSKNPFDRQARRQTLSYKLSEFWQPSVLQSVATKLRGKVEKPEEIQFVIPRIMVQPSTPEGSSESDTSDTDSDR